ncbi:hypothetical protein OF83DRAFT_1085935 [Amylostereum chailletii]|nr:hypothetical protein OF83DRAFT_1085935 [Amylostereum chailletii]
MAASLSIDIASILASMVAALAPLMPDTGVLAAIAAVGVAMCADVGTADSDAGVVPALPTTTPYSITTGRAVAFERAEAGIDGDILGVPAIAGELAMTAVAGASIIAMADGGAPAMPTGVSAIITIAVAGVPASEAMAIIAPSGISPDASISTVFDSVLAFDFARLCSFRAFGDEDRSRTLAERVNRLRSEKDEEEEGASMDDDAPTDAFSGGVAYGGGSLMFDSPARRGRSAWRTTWKGRRGPWSTVSSPWDWSGWRIYSGTGSRLADSASVSMADDDGRVIAADEDVAVSVIMAGAGAMALFMAEAGTMESCMAVEVDIMVEVGTMESCMVIDVDIIAGASCMAGEGAIALCIVAEVDIMTSFMAAGVGAIASAMGGEVEVDIMASAIMAGAGIIASIFATGAAIIASIMAAGAGGGAGGSEPGGGGNRSTGTRVRDPLERRATGSPALEPTVVAGESERIMWVVEEAGVPMDEWDPSDIIDMVATADMWDTADATMWLGATGEDMREGSWEGGRGMLVATRKGFVGRLSIGNSVTVSSFSAILSSETDSRTFSSGSSPSSSRVTPSAALSLSPKG